jgi:hypothetical protein
MLKITQVQQQANQGVSQSIKLWGKDKNLYNRQHSSFKSKQNFV